MKKIISILSVVMFLVIMILPMSASAITASGSLTGPSTVKQGGSFTVTFSMNGSGIESVNGSLSYDSSKMSLTGTKQIIASPWTISFTGNNFLAYDGSDSTALIKSSKSIFSATFKLKSGVAVGTKISVSVSGVLVSDHDSSYRFPSAPTYSATVVASGTTTKKATITTKRTTTTTKKSSATTTTTTGKSDTGAADLASININGVELKPAFDPKTTSYTAQVANNVKNLDVTAKAKDSSAKVDIGKTELDEGPNKIDITVKAANGEAKVYTLNVTRLALSSSRLASLIVEGFDIDPAFSPDISEYRVTVPFTTEQVRIIATPENEQATIDIDMGIQEKLSAGEDNEINVICTQPDGSKSVYKVIVHREAADEDDSKSTPLWLILVISFGSILVGFGIGYLVFGRKSSIDS